MARRCTRKWYHSTRRATCWCVWPRPRRARCCAQAPAQAEESDAIELLLQRKFRIRGGGRFLMSDDVMEARDLGRRLVSEVGGAGAHRARAHSRTCRRAELCHDQRSLHRARSCCSHSRGISTHDEENHSTLIWYRRRRLRPSLSRRHQRRRQQLRRLGSTRCPATAKRRQIRPQRPTRSRQPWRQWSRRQPWRVTKWE